MQHSPPEYAQALYEVLRDKDERGARKAIKVFVERMRSRGLMALLPNVLREMPDAARRVEGTEEVLVETAYEIDDKISRKAAGIVSEGEPEVSVRVNPKLIGGIRIRGRDKVYDATMKAGLERISNALKK